MWGSEYQNQILPSIGSVVQRFNTRRAYSPKSTSGLRNLSIASLRISASLPFMRVIGLRRGEKIYDG
jgi:hypothetical protein